MAAGIATVKKQIELPAGVTPKQVTCTLRLYAVDDGSDGWGYDASNDADVAGVRTVKPDATGLVTFTAVRPNSTLTPANSVYELTTVFPDRRRIVEYISVPNSAGPHWVQDILVAAPDNLTGWASLDVYNVKNYGAVGDGSTDDTTAVSAAITAAASSGGTVWFPAGTYKLTSSLSIPNDGATLPQQKPLRLTGAGPRWSGEASGLISASNGGAILDFRSASTPACIDTRGVGFLEVDRLTFTQLGTAHTVPYIQTTNTVVAVHDCAFFGHSTKTTTSCDQDAIVLGGTTENLDGTATAAFQGYGSTITGNYFDRIRRGVYGRTYANAIVIRDNTFWRECGGASGTAAIEFVGLSNSYCSGAHIAGNLIEMVGYTYGFKFTYTLGFVLDGNSLYDPGVNATSAVRCETGAEQNTIRMGYMPGTMTSVSEHATVAGKNTVLVPDPSLTSQFNAPIRFVQGIKLGDGSPQDYLIEQQDGPPNSVRIVDSTNSRNMLIATGAAAGSANTNFADQIIITRGAAGQANALIEWRNESAVRLGSISPAGELLLGRTSSGGGNGVTMYKHRDDGTGVQWVTNEGARWYIYMTGGNDLYFRDQLNGRMQLTFQTGSAGNANATLLDKFTVQRGSSGQTANLLELQDQTAAVLASVGPAGNLTTTGYTGGFRAITSGRTLTADDQVVSADATGGAFNVTLPTAVGCTGREYTVKRINSGANAVTVNTTSSQTIDGATTYSLGSQYKYVTVVSNGANWLITANN